MRKTSQAFVAGMTVTVPPSLKKDRYQAGFAHALHGGQLDKVEYLKLSFREGYRAAKLHMREARYRQGIIDFPLRGKLKVKALQ
jgi:hypothetical protein